MDEKVICLSLGENMVGRVADELMRLAPDGDGRRIACVFGGKRPSLFVNREMARRMKVPYLPARFFSMDEFVSYAVGQQQPFSMMTDLEAAYGIYRVCADSAPEIIKEREDFSRFLPWAREILGLIEQLDFEDVSEEVLMSVQGQARIGFEADANINTLFENIRRVRELFHSFQVSRGMLTRGMLYSMASRLACGLEMSQWDTILVVGLFYWHKTEEVLWTELRKKIPCRFIFQGDERDWPSLTKASRILSCQIQPGRQEKFTGELSLRAGFDSHSQVCLAREALVQIPQDEWERTVVVLADTDMVIPLLTEISADIDDLNVTMGYPLKRASISALLESIFKAQQTRVQGKYYVKDYLRVLSHPIAKNLVAGESGAVTRILVHKVEEALRGLEESVISGSLFVTLQEVEASEDVCRLAAEEARSVDPAVTAPALAQLLTRLHKTLFIGWEDIETFVQLAGALDELLAAIVTSESFLSRYPVDAKIVERLLDLVREYQVSSFSQERFDSQEIFQIFLSQIEHEKVAFSGSPLKGLQIMGLYETRALDFKNVVVVGANESVLPRLKVSEPIFPRDVMAQLGVHRLEKEEEIQRYLLWRLIAGAQKAVIIYSQDDQHERSRFVERLVWEQEKASGRCGVLSVEKGAFQLEIIPRTVQVVKNPAEMDFLKTMRFSASSLNTYLQCPLRFYFQYGLGLRERDDALDDWEASDMGDFIHAFLETALSRFIGTRPSFGPEFHNAFQATLDEMFDNRVRRRMRSDAFLVKAVVDFRLAFFLEYERARRYEKILALEHDIGATLVLDERPIVFGCRLDRIDQIQEGDLLVIDYKTGTSDVIPSTLDQIETKGLNRLALKETLKSFQLPLYIRVMEQTYPQARVNAAIYDLRGGRKEFGLKPLIKDDAGWADLGRMRDVYSRAMGAVIHEIFDMNMPFVADDSDPRRCQVCPFKAFCQ